MNNKKLGSNFERQMCELYAQNGYWVHFISPDARGSQPFDIIAVKNGRVIVFDCKTCKDHIFRLSRLEDNQVMAFEKWIACGNPMPYIAVEYQGAVYMIDYDRLKRSKKIDLRKESVGVWLISAESEEENVTDAENVKSGL